MFNFKSWLNANESSPSTRRALGTYPPQPGDFFVRPPYGKASTCKKVGGFKLYNMDISSLCKEKGKDRKKSD
jgi:hypothetical protein